MKNPSPVVGPSRRTLLSALVALGLAACTNDDGSRQMARLASLVLPRDKWSAEQLHAFLKALPPGVMRDLKQAIDLADRPVTTPDPAADADAVVRRLLWLSSNVLAYPFKSAEALNYHRVVSWVAGKAGIAKDTIDTGSTFWLEHELMRVLFVGMWDKLEPRQREEVLGKIDASNAIKNKAAIAALGGAGALAALSGTVALTGFAFYTTMSVTMAAVAGVLGATIPFAGYAGASALVGVLSGPVGWAIVGVAGLGGLALKGRANAEKSASVLLQIHALKVQALQSAGVPESRMFTG